MPAARALAVAHFDAADNMTDTFAALAALKDGVYAERDALFARFEAQLARRAAGPRQVVRARGAGRRAPIRSRACRRCLRIRASTRAIRIACARSSARSRCAISRGSMRRDGGGYAFAADQVLALDATNPQLGGDGRGRVQPVEALPRAAARTDAGGAAADRRRAGAVARCHRSGDAHACRLTPRRVTRVAAGLA